MKKALFATLTVILLACMAVCSASKPFVPDYESAIGVILANAGQELPENAKIYAGFQNSERLTAVLLSEKSPLFIEDEMG